MYVYYNPNPEKNHVGDCVVRALTVALDDTWDNAIGTGKESGYSASAWIESASAPQ